MKSDRKQIQKQIVVVAHDLKDSPIYGHNSDTELVFDDEDTFKKYFQEELFTVHKGHYIRDGQLRFARVIICVWKGKAYCTLNMDRRFQPSDDQGKNELEKTDRQEYQVESSDWFENPVDLTSMGISNMKNMPFISSELHEKILTKAGNLTRYKI
jgi:hypothetical protein